MYVYEHVSTAQAPLLHPLTDLRREHGFVPLRVEGTLPADLRGTLYRNGPAKFTEVGVDHWFDGMAAISAVRLTGDGAAGAVRLVHTDSVDADLAARRPTRGGYRFRASPWNRLRSLLGGRGFKNLANINVLWWQEQLLALYEAAPPVRIDPDTLASLGEQTLGGVVQSFQAHPHRVPARRATYNTGMRIGREVKLDLYELPDRGAPRTLTTLDLPGVSEVHDFAATRDHLVVILTPLWAPALSLIRQGSFERSLTFHPDQPTRVIVVPIDAPERRRVFEAPPFFFYHAANGFEDGDRITVDLVRYPDFSVSEHLQRLTAGREDLSPFHATMTRLTVDLSRDDVSLTTLDDCPSEFPWVHPLRQSLRHRYVWTASYVGDTDRGWWSALTRLDTERGQRALYDPGARRAIGEPVLVERSDRESDLWILAMVHDLDEDASHLAIFDGDRPGEPPVARCWFDHPIPHSLHGTWTPQ